MSEEFVQAVWVVGVYEGGRAKSVMELGDAGMTYIILERGGSKFAPTCMAAFRWMLANGPVPDHLTEVMDIAKIEEYEKIRKRK